MQGCQLLSLLPSRLSCIILQEWLTLKSVMVLDSAYCCHSHRNEFLRLLQSNEYFVRENLVIRDSMTKFGETVEGFDVRMLERFGEKLRSVSFHGEFSPTQVRPLQQHCQNLTHVSYNDTETGASGLWEVLKGNTNIESLDVFLHFFAAGVPENSMPNLKSLSVRKAWHNTTTSLENTCALNAMKLSNNIVRLSVGANLNPATLLQIPVLCSHISTLALSFTDVSDAVLHSITAACPHIVHLDLHTSRELTDAGIHSVVKNLKRLHSLNILDIRALTDASLKHIYTHCANTLHTLCFGSCNDSGAMFSAEAVNIIRYCNAVHYCVWYVLRNTITLYPYQKVSTSYQLFSRS